MGQHTRNLFNLARINQILSFGLNIVYFKRNRIRHSKNAIEALSQYKHTICTHSHNTITHEMKEDEKYYATVLSEASFIGNNIALTNKATRSFYISMNC